MNDLQQQVREFITANFLFDDDAALSNDASLIELGIIDSTGVLELVVFLETTYGLTLEDEELTPANLDSVNRITRLIDRKLRVIA